MKLCGIVKTVVDIFTMITQAKLENSSSFTNIYLLAIVFFAANCIDYIDVTINVIIFDVFSPSFMHGQAVQSNPHFVIPLCFLLGYLFCILGI